MRLAMPHISEEEYKEFQALKAARAGKNMETYSISTREKWELSYLANHVRPLWGGHLSRGEPPNWEIQNWLDRGLIKQVGNHGYIITDFGRRVCRAAT